jgi:mannonate dehydratase
VFYFEDPLPPENLDTFRIIRQQTSTPIAMVEAYTGLWAGKELITEHLIDYMRHDLAHVGGISTRRKIATLLRIVRQPRHRSQRKSRGQISLQAIPPAHHPPR